MYHGNSVAVVVPAYNEAPHIREVVESLPSLVDRAYVVDDASTDGTWAEIRAVVRAAPSSRTVAPETAARTTGPPDRPDDSPGRSPDGGTRQPPDAASGTAAGRRTEGDRSGTQRDGDPGEFPLRLADGDDGPAIVAVRHPENRGRGAAVKKGYRLAMADGMDVVAVVDGDGQMDPAQLEHVVHPVATGVADYAKGNRLDGPEYWRGMSPWRLFGNVLLTGLTRISSGYWGLRDPQNGYTAISRATLEEIDLTAVYDDYGFLNDMLAELNMVDARVADVSLPAVYGEEESGIRYRQFVPAVSLLLLVNFLRRLYVDGVRRRRVWLPATYALAVGGWFGAVGAAAAIVVAGIVLPSAVPLTATGVVATALAVGLDRLQNASLEQHRRGDAGVETG